MAWKANRTTLTGGWSASGTISRPLTVALGLWKASRDSSRGIWIPYTTAWPLYQPSRCSAAPRVVVASPSNAASLVGPAPRPAPPSRRPRPAAARRQPPRPARWRAWLLLRARRRDRVLRSPRARPARRGGVPGGRVLGPASRGGVGESRGPYRAAKSGGLTRLWEARPWRATASAKPRHASTPRSCWRRRCSCWHPLAQRSSPSSGSNDVFGCLHAAHGVTVGARAYGPQWCRRWRCPVRLPRQRRRGARGPAARG